MQKHDFLDAVPLYALDALNEGETRRLQDHLVEGCDLCESELRIYQEIGCRMPYALPDSQLPSHLKEQIWSALQAKSPAQRKPVNWGVLAAAAAIVAVILSGWWISQIHRQLAQSNQALVDLRKLWIEQRREIEWLRDPSVQLALLTGLQSAPDARGKMLWNPQVSRGIFYANSLPALSPEKSYQLWVIGNAGPVSAAVFSTDPKGGAVVTITQMEATPQGSLQFAVTIEPRGGLPKPSGPMVLAGKPL